MPTNHPTAASDPLPDNLLDSVLSAIGPEVLRSFNDEQMSSVTNALQSTGKRHRHLMRVQGKVPFFSFYYYFAMGKDRRVNQMRIVEEHRRPRRFLSSLGFFFTVAAGITAIALVSVIALDAVIEEDLMELLYIRDGIGWVKGLIS